MLVAMVELGSSVGAGHQGDFQAMIHFFKRAMGFQGIPPGRLPKFHGTAERPGERNFREWLEDFEQIVAPLNITEKEKVRVMLEHLARSAEEIMGLPTGKRDSVTEIKKILELCFTVMENLQSLTTAFHNRKQGEQETLADFSGALMRLYGKME